MSSRTFEHPMQRHPAVAPLLSLLETRARADLGRGLVQAKIVKLRAVLELENWAIGRFALSESPGYGARLADEVRTLVPQAVAYARLPKPLAAVHRADEHDFALTEAARLLADEGPEAARAYVAKVERPSLATRRLAAEGWWPGVQPTFVGRLDESVRPEAYRPSVPLTDALAAQGRFRDAHSVARRLPFRARRWAERAIVRQKVASGAAPGSLTGFLHEEYLWQSALLAADRQNPSAAIQFVDEMRDGARQTIAMHEVRARLGKLMPYGVRTADDATALPSGETLMMNAERALASGQPQQAWAMLCSAATGPRRDSRFWLDGVRPDLRIAQRLLTLSMTHSFGAPWPWGSRQQEALLDRLDAVGPALAPVGRRQIEEALSRSVLRPKWLQARVRQALFVRSVERIDVAAIDRHMYGRADAEAFIRGLMGDLTFAQQLSTDPADPIRALYDDGLARSPRAARRRCGLLQAAKRTIQANINGTESALPAAEIRLGTLTRLGGDRARRMLDHQLGLADSDHPLFPSMTRALLRIDADHMSAKLLADPRTFGYRFDAYALHEALEDKGRAGRGYVGAVRDLHAAVAQTLDGGVDEWWFSLCTHWWSLHRSPPTEGILRWLAIQPPEWLRAGPRWMLAKFVERRRALARMDPSDLIRHFLEDRHALADLLLNTPFGRDYGRSWSIADWRMILARLAGKVRPIPRPDRALVEQWAQTRPLDVGESLLRGHPPLPELDAPLSVPGCDRYTLRYLHKCRDVLRFWRFADVVNCCYNSNGRFYVTGDAQRHVLELWRDPLSFCFEILAADRTCGFVFGGFGRVDRRSALLLNGIYLRKAGSAKLRAGILEAITRAMQVPLRLEVVGIANRFGGTGPLPDAYRLEKAHVWRYRALSTAERRVRRVYDDIGRVVNTWTTAELHWKGL